MQARASEAVHHRYYPTILHSSTVTGGQVIGMLTKLWGFADGVLRMKGQPDIAMVGRCLLFREPSNVRISVGVPFSVIALTGGSVGAVRLYSLSRTLLHIRYTTCSGGHSCSHQGCKA